MFKMKADEYPKTLLRLWGNPSEHVFQTKKGTGNASKFEPAEFSALSEYLEAPNSAGYWRLTASWKSDGAFSQFVLAQLKDELREVEDEEEVESEGEGEIGRQIVKYALALQEGKKEKLITTLTSRLSPLFQTFAGALKPIKKNRAKGLLRETESWIEKIDHIELKAQFPEAFKVFQEKIYTESLSNGVQQQSPFRIQKGLVFMLRGPREGLRLVLASASHDGLTDLFNFLSAAGQIRHANIERVFSPEEELFEPYSHLFRSHFRI